MHKRGDAMEHCKDCKWWDMQLDYPVGYGACECSKFRTDLDPTEDDDAVMIMDADCYLHSQLLFGPEFGCVHFEKGKRNATLCDHQN